MKKMYLGIIIFLLIWVFPISAKAEEFPESLKTPVLQYKLVNHDKISLRWNKIEGADKYYIYQQNPNTNKYVKKGEVKTTSCTIKNLKAETEYSYAVVAVKENDEGTIKSKSSNKVFLTTPADWHYFYSNEYSEDSHYQEFRTHFDGSGKEMKEEGASGEWGFVYGSNFIYHKGWIYYTYFSDTEYKFEDAHPSYSLYRVRNDGTKIEEVVGIGTQNVGKIAIIDDNLYLLLHQTTLEWGNEYGNSSIYECSLYKYSLDGKESERLYYNNDNEEKYFLPYISNYIVDFEIKGDTIYYVMYNELTPSIFKESLNSDEYEFNLIRHC